MKTKCILWAIAAVVLLSCATINNLFPTEDHVLPNNALATNSALSLNDSIPTATLRPTTDPQILGERQGVGELPFSFQAPWYYNAEINGREVLINDDSYVIFRLFASSKQGPQSIESFFLFFLEDWGEDPNFEDFEYGEFVYTLVGGVMQLLRI